MVLREDPMTEREPARGRRILVVDDDEDLRALVAATLTAERHSVTLCASAREGLDAAASVQPELVISDVLMPEMDGWAFIRELRSRPASVLTPVIFLTALSSKSDRLRGFRLGADDYLPKPFSTEELLLRVTRVLETQVGNKPTSRSIGGADLEARLEHIGLPALLLMLELERKSGTVRVESESDSCEIHICGGNAVDARTDSGLRDAEAIYAALLWSSGGFSFGERELELEDRIGMDTTHILLEGARRIDEAASEDPISIVH